MQQDKRPIPNLAIRNGGVFLRLGWQFTFAHHVIHNLAEENIDLLFHPKAQIQLHVDHIISAISISCILRRVWLIRDVNGDKPVDTGALWPFIQDGVQDFFFNVVIIGNLRHINQVGGVGWIFRITAKFG